MNLLWGESLNSRFPLSDLGAAHPSRQIAVNVSLKRVQLCVGNSGGRTDQPTDRQTDRQTTRRSSPQIQLMWCARQSAAHWLLRRPQSLARNSHLLSRLSSWKYDTGNASLKLFQYKGLCSEWRLGANVWNTKVNFRKLFWKVASCTFFLHYCLLLCCFVTMKHQEKYFANIIFNCF